MISKTLQTRLKKMALLGLVSISVFSLAACGGKKKSKGTTNKSTEMTEVDSEGNVVNLGNLYEGTGYTISAPSNWADAKTRNESLDLMIYDTNITGDFARNLNIIIEDLSAYSSMDADKYLDAAKTKLVQSGYAVEDGENKDINGVYTTSLIYSYTTNGYVVKGQQTYFYNEGDKNVYIVTFACAEEEFETYKEAGNEIINTFQFD